MFPTAPMTGALLLSIPLLALPLATADNVLKQVIVITRHGSRFPLHKTDDLQEEFPGRLTPFGERQLYDLGRWLHTTYNQTGFLDQFYPDKVRLESSYYERTITSANSLALGLFAPAARDPTQESLLPVPPANIPVYSRDQGEDIQIRAYDKCPSFHERLETLYHSEEWTRLENENSDLLAHLADMTQFRPFSSNAGIIPLEQLWNVYDMVSVAKTECPEGAQEVTPTCESLPNPEAASLLTDVEWIKVQQLSHKAELMKYGQQTAGKIIGVNLLLEILARMQNGDYQFSLFSAHYPTILGIFSALEEVFFEEQIIPHYGAALLFEVTEEIGTGEPHFKLVYKGDDRPSTAAVVVQLDRVCGNPLVCPVSALAEYLGDWDTEKWCRECRNEFASVCLRLRFLNQQQSSSSSGDDEDDSSLGNSLKHPVESGFLIGIVVGIFGMFLVAALYLHKKTVKETGDGVEYMDNANGTGFDVSDAAHEPSEGSGAQTTTATATSDLKDVDIAENEGGTLQDEGVDDDEQSNGHRMMI